MSRKRPRPRPAQCRFGEQSPCRDLPDALDREDLFCVQRFVRILYPHPDLFDHDAEYAAWMCRALRRKISTETVLALVATFPDRLDANIFGTTMEYACEQNRRMVVDALHARGVPMHLRALRTLIAHGRVPLLEYALTLYNGCLNTPVDSRGATLLIGAANQGKTACVNLLIGAGACVDVRNAKGRTPLMMCRDTLTMAHLLQAGADIHAADPDGVTALMHQLEFGTWVRVDMLLLKGARLDVVDGNGSTPLMYAIDNRGDAATMVDAVLTRDPQAANRRYVDGETVLHILARADPDDLAVWRRVLRDTTTDTINALDTYDVSAIRTIAAIKRRQHSPVLVKMLLRAGADPERGLDNGLLHDVVQNHVDDIVQDGDPVDVSRLSAGTRDREVRHCAIVRLLVEHVIVECGIPRDLAKHIVDFVGPPRRRLEYCMG